MKTKPTAMEAYQFARLADHVSATMGVDHDELRSRSQSHRLLLARSFISFVLREMEMSFSRIGGAMNKDHSAIRKQVIYFDKALQGREVWAVRALRSLAEVS